VSAPPQTLTAEISWQTLEVSLTSSFVAADLVVNSNSFTAPLVVIGLVVGAYVTTRISGFVLRRVVGRVAKRSLTSPTSLWRTRARRASLETSEVTEQRRRLRIDAAARMVNHLVSVMVWLITAISIFHVLEINAAFYLSSAGFLGAALAFGGQHKVNDYLTGLSVHFEDRYGVGDEVTFDVGWDEPVNAVVDHIGLFSTRVRDSTSTMHFSNAALAQIRNLSQEPAAATIRLKTSGHAPEQVAETLRGLAGTSDLTQVVFLGDIASYEPSTGEVEVDVHTLRPLDPKVTERLVERAERALGKLGKEPESSQDQTAAR
jgi:small-conductance mechanosensitive channel